MGFFLFYIASTSMALFVTYLYAFRGYRHSFLHNDWIKLLDSMPPVTWILCLMISFMPALNLAGSFVGLVWPLTGELGGDDIKIDHWLYRTREKSNKE